MNVVERLAASVGPEEAEILERHLMLESCKPGRALLMEGVPANDLYFVLDGTLTVSVRTAGGDVALGVVRPGEWIGEIGFIDGGPSTATVTTAQTMNLLRISHDDLMRLQASHPRAAAVLMRTVTAQLADRLVRSTRGIVEQVAEGRYRLRKEEPEETRGWLSRALGALFGGAR